MGKYGIGEADRIYTAYTLEIGKIKIIAKGVKKPLAKLAGCLEDFNLAELEIVRKKGMGKITGAIVENSFLFLKSDLGALRCAFLGINALNRLTETEDKDEKSFHLLVQFLKALDTQARNGKNNFDILLQGFIFNLFSNLGYAIEAKNCVRCFDLLSENGNYFSSELGGVVCRKCSEGMKNKLEISGNAIKILRIFRQNKIGSLFKLLVNSKDLKNLDLISKRFLEWLK